MEKLTNWHKMWQELSDIQARAFARQKKDRDGDFWRHKADKFDKMVEQRWEKPDSSRKFLMDKLKKDPGSTLLDIGAGTGRWSIFASSSALKVTALEPSPAMQEILKEKIKKEGITNIEIITGSWPDHDICTHDYVLSSHSIYGVGDFKGFVDKMSRTALKGCMMILRVPFAGSVMAAAANRVFGQPHDSPNLQIAFNALMNMGIYPDVIMEQSDNWPAWSHDSFEDAFADLKNRLDIVDNFEHDGFLIDLLNNSLTLKNGKYIWPPGNTSALVYWEDER